MDNYKSIYYSLKEEEEEENKTAEKFRELIKKYTGYDIYEDTNEEELFCEEIAKFLIKKKHGEDLKQFCEFMKENISESLLDSVNNLKYPTNYEFNMDDLDMDNLRTELFFSAEDYSNLKLIEIKNIKYFCDVKKLINLIFNNSKRYKLFPIVKLYKHYYCYVSDEEFTTLKNIITNHFLTYTHDEESNMSGLIKLDIRII